jgi:diguanylate cyclase (GGDEF)-like protein
MPTLGPELGHWHETEGRALRLLIVVPDRARVPAVMKAVGAAGRSHELTLVASPEETRAVVDDAAADCVLVDLAGDPAAAVERFAALHDLASSVPLVALTDAEKEDLAVLVLGLGAQDCVSTSGVSGPRLRRALRHAMARHAVQQSLLARAFTDHVTGLPNRELFLDRLGHALARTQRHRGTLAVMFVDVDEFKPINDSFGHEVGDRVLAGFARHLLRVLRPSDTVARYGGDEFTVLCEDAGAVEDTVAVARRVASVARAPLIAGPHRIQLTVSVGVAFSNARTGAPGELVAQADAAMYEAKTRPSGIVIGTDEHREMALRGTLTGGGRPLPNRLQR